MNSIQLKVRSVVFNGDFISDSANKLVLNVTFL